MSEFDIENMRYIPSPLEILEQAHLSQEGLVRAVILDPTDSELTSVIGYSYMWNRNVGFGVAENERLKVVSFAIGEAATDATLAYILEEQDASEGMESRAELHRSMDETSKAFDEQLRQMQAESQRRREQDILQDKKNRARLDIMSQAELTPDALDLIQREVETENPELHFPDAGDNNQDQ
jgi:hypothetical protein